MLESRRVRTRRWLVPALVLIGWLAAGGLLGPLAGKLGEVVESGAAAYLPESAEATQVLDLMQRFGEPEAMPAVLVYDAGGATLDAADRAAVAADVQSVGTTLAPHLAAPPIGPEMSADGGAARVVLLFSGTDETKITPYVEQLRRLVADRPGLAAHVTGPAGVQADVQDALGAIDLMLLVITSALILVILVLVYRSPLLPFVVLAVAGTALGVTQGIIYLLAERGVLALGSEVQGILSVLVIGAATDYALLLIARYRDELRDSPNRHLALAAALRASAGPIVASAGTIALGLLCLLLSHLGLNRQLGPAGAIGILCAVIAMLTFLPAVLALLGRAAFWPRRPEAAPGAAAAADGVGRWGRIVALVGRRPRAVWAGIVVVLAVLSLGVLRLDADGLSTTEMLIADNTESEVGQQVLAEHFPAGSGSPVIVVADADKLPAVVAAARGVPDVAQVVPFTGGGVTPVIVDGLARTDVTLAVAPDSQAATDAVLALRSAVHAVPGADAKVGGTTAIDVDFDATARADRIVIPVLLGVVFLIVLVLLRALVASILLLATVVLSFLAAIGVSTVVFHDLLGFPGVDSTFPLHAFVFLVALGVDYNIFLVSRVREESLRVGTRRGTAVGLAVTGGVITSAGVVLAATFAALAVIPLVLMVELAFTVAFGVLLDTLIVRTLLVPALFTDVGRLIWWPGKLARVRDAAIAAGPAAVAGTASSSRTSSLAVHPVSPAAVSTGAAPEPAADSKP